MNLNDMQKAEENSQRLFKNQINRMKSSGFASPSEDYLEPRLNIHQLVVSNNATTFFMRVAHVEYACKEINLEDILVIDRSLQLSKTCYFIGISESCFALYKKRGALITNLKTGQQVNGESIEYWGRVTYIIRKT